MERVHDPTRNPTILGNSTSAGLGLGSFDSSTASGGRGSAARAGVPAIAG